jgi:hypothetical protein
MVAVIVFIRVETRDRLIAHLNRTTLTALAVYDRYKIPHGSHRPTRGGIARF